MINSGQLSKLDFDSSQCWSGWCDISPTQPTPLAGYAGIERLADIKATGLEANCLFI